MSRYTQTYEVMSHDVDVNNNARPSVIATLMQETANHHMRDRRPTYYELFEEGKSYVLIRYSCDIFGSLNPYDQVTVHTWTCESKGATFVRCYAMEKKGVEIARAYTEWAVVDIKSGHIFKVTDIDCANFEKDEALTLDMPNKFRFPEDVEFSCCGEKEIFYGDCDMNYHMNNTHYQDILWNYIPDVEKKIITGFSLRFMKEAHLGKKLEIYMAKGDDVQGGEERWYFKTLVEDSINIEAIIRCREIQEDDRWEPMAVYGEM